MRLLEELIAGYQDPGFQRALALIYHEHLDDEDQREIVKKRRALTMTVQASVLPKYGFEATDLGVHKSWLAYQKPPLSTDPEIFKRNMVIGYLIESGPKAIAASMRRRAEECARFDKIRLKGDKPMVISLPDGLSMLEELVSGYQDPDMQRGLALIYKWHGSAEYSEDDPAFLRARRALLMAVQGAVLPRYGFEASQSGVHASFMAYQRPEFLDNSEYKRVNELIGYFVREYPIERSVEAGQPWNLGTEACLRRQGVPLPACPEHDPPTASSRSPRAPADQRCALCRACVELTAGQWARDCGRARGDKCGLLAEGGERHPALLGGWECVAPTTFYPPPVGSAPLQLLAAELEAEAAGEEVAGGTTLAPEACFQIRPAARLLLEALEEQRSLGRVLELGAGTGTVGLSLASRGVTSSAMLTDGDPRCVQLLRANASLSGAPVEVPAATLALGETPRGRPFDTVIASEPLRHWLSVKGDSGPGPGELLSTAGAALCGPAGGRLFFSHQHGDPYYTEWLLGEVAHRGGVVREVIADAAPDKDQPGGQARLSVYWLEFRDGWRLPGGVQLAERAGAEVPSLVWDSQRSSMVQHQVSQWTQFDRHPEIFGALRSIVNESCGSGWVPKILSFGCSDGSECRTMRMYFPEAVIDGIDIDAELIARNRAENHDPDIRYFDDVGQLPLGSYDAVLMMTVLCHYGDHTEDRLPFEAFDQTVVAIDRCVRLNGYFVIYNANYLFTEASIAHRYANLAEGDGPAAAACRFSSGWVPKFSRAGRKISTDGAEFPWVFFQKRAAAGVVGGEHRGK